MPSPFTPAFLKAFVLLPTSLALTLSSCTTQNAIKPGHALLEIENDRANSDRVRKPEIVSVNGTALSPAEHLSLSPGKQKVRIQYGFPGTTKLYADLNFKARANQRYAVKFDLFPPNGSLTDDTGESFAGFMNGVGSSEAAAFLIVPWMVYAGGKAIVKKGAHSAEHYSKRVEWAYIDVISTDPTEGIVQRIRIP